MRKYKVVVNAGLLERSVHGHGWSPYGNPWGSGDPFQSQAALKVSLGFRVNFSGFNTWLYFCEAFRAPLMILFWPP